MHFRLITHEAIKKRLSFYDYTVVYRYFDRKICFNSVVTKIISICINEQTNKIKVVKKSSIFLFFFFVELLDWIKRGN